MGLKFCWLDLSDQILWSSMPHPTPRNSCCPSGHHPGCISTPLATQQASRVAYTGQLSPAAMINTRPPCFASSGRCPDFLAVRHFRVPVRALREAHPLALQQVPASAKASLRRNVFMCSFFAGIWGSALTLKVREDHVRGSGSPVWGLLARRGTCADQRDGVHSAVTG